MLRSMFARSWLTDLTCSCHSAETLQARRKSQANNLFILKRFLHALSIQDASRVSCAYLRAIPPTSPLLLLCFSTYPSRSRPFHSPTTYSKLSPLPHSILPSMPFPHSSHRTCLFARMTLKSIARLGKSANLCPVFILYPLQTCGVCCGRRRPHY